MTRDELLARLRALEEDKDNKFGQYADAEDVHIAADALLLWFIHDREIAHAYNELYRWYS